MITPARLAALIKTWKAEAAIARRCERSDEYARLCEETVGALRELERCRVQLSQMTSLAGSALVQLYEAFSGDGVAGE